MIADSALSQLLEQLVDRKVSEFMPATVIRRDFALEADGGMVECSLTTGCFPWSTYGWGSSPTRAITEDVRIGQCWLVHSPHARLGVVLAEPIYPTHVTIDHVPRQLAADIGEAPHAMTLWGVVDGQENLSRYTAMSLNAELEGASTMKQYFVIPLASFEYDITRSPSQSFPIYDHIRQSGMDFGIVVLEIRSNWGSQKSCLYRLRVHGSSSLDTENVSHLP
ncbi:hypothetical protein BDW22DRAFT_1408443 [Trametopsis cervina]|nr:hypothetical protein BDW22DRAFT_1408443 [Trametopsis cervina]